MDMGRDQKWHVTVRATGRVEGSSCCWPVDSRGSFTVNRTSENGKVAFASRRPMSIFICGLSAIMFFSI